LCVVFFFVCGGGRGLRGARYWVGGTRGEGGASISPEVTLLGGGVPARGCVGVFSRGFFFFFVGVCFGLLVFVSLLRLQASPPPDDCGDVFRGIFDALLV